MNGIQLLIALWKREEMILYHIEELSSETPSNSADSHCAFIHYKRSAIYCLCCSFTLCLSAAQSKNAVGAEQGPGTSL